MPARRLVLASGSQPRLRLLQAAGFAPEAIPSHVEEDGVDDLSPEKAAVTLAARKATAVADRLRRSSTDAIVVGCDTLLLLQGAALGKPESLAQAAQWCKAQRNGEVDVVTGHCVIDLANDREAADHTWTKVLIGPMTDEEIEAYLATGEAMNAAGALTIDGYGAPYIVGIQGDYGTVVGLSLPMLRTLLDRIGIAITSLWRDPQSRTRP